MAAKAVATIEEGGQLPPELAALLEQGGWEGAEDLLARERAVLEHEEALARAEAALAAREGLLAAGEQRLAEVGASPLAFFCASAQFAPRASSGGIAGLLGKHLPERRATFFSPCNVSPPCRPCRPHPHAGAGSAGGPRSCVAGP